MKTLSVSEAKMKLSAVVEAVQSTDEEVMITRNGSPVAYVVSTDEFEGWKETVSIKNDADFLGEIAAGLKNIQKGRAKLYSLEELFR